MLALKVEHNVYNKWPCECNITISDHTDPQSTTVATVESDVTTNSSDHSTEPVDTADILRECM